MPHPHDLIRFLRARYAEEETKALAAAAEWATETTEQEWQDLPDAVYSHAQAHDPAHVLATLKGKRAVLDAWDDIDYEMPWYVYDALAAVYADHPDYPR